MVVDTYRRVFAYPGVRSLVGVAVLARIPVAATSVTVTLHVVLTLRLGYLAAGLVAAAFTIGAAFGGPWMGRVVDRHGLRRMLLITTVVETPFWAAAPFLPYALLVGASVVGGVFALPVSAVARQAIAALVPEERRRAAYSMDSVMVELSFMIGPAVGVLLATRVSTTTAMLALGGSLVLAGLGMYVLNPPVRSADTGWGAVRPTRRTWLTGPMLALLLTASGATIVLTGTDVAVIAVLQHAGQVDWAGLVIAVWCVASAIGGFVHGTTARPLSPRRLMGLMGLLTIPVGLAGQWWLLALAVVPAGLLCAPTIAATSDHVSQFAPESVRGEAMGLYSSAMTVGSAVSAPLVGAVIDRSTPAWGFVVAGVAGLLIAILARILSLPTRSPVGPGAAST